jgi:hypothetical protein
VFFLAPERDPFNHPEQISAPEDDVFRIIYPPIKENQSNNTQANYQSYGIVHRQSYPKLRRAKAPIK